MQSRIIQGAAIPTMKTLPDQSIDLIVVDPPYFKIKGLWWDKQWSTEEGYRDWFSQLVNQWHRLLAPRGSLYIFAHPKRTYLVETEIRKRFNVLNHITWAKSAARGFEGNILRPFPKNCAKPGWPPRYLLRSSPLRSEHTGQLTTEARFQIGRLIVACHQIHK
jgi:DNA modification methylase